MDACCATNRPPAGPLVRRGPIDRSSSVHPHKSGSAAPALSPSSRGHERRASKSVEAVHEDHASETEPEHARVLGLHGHDARCDPHAQGQPEVGHARPVRLDSLARLRPQTRLRHGLRRRHGRRRSAHKATNDSQRINHTCAHTQTTPSRSSNVWFVIMTPPAGRHGTHHSRAPQRSFFSSVFVHPPPITDPSSTLVAPLTPPLAPLALLAVA